MVSASIEARLKQTFLGELEERLAVLEEGLVRLERGLSADGLELLRAAHSLKGASRAVGARRIERICHELESQLGEVPPGGFSFTAEEIATLLKLVDRLRREGDRFGAPPSVAAQPSESSADIGEPAAALPVPPPAADLLVRLDRRALDELAIGVGELGLEASSLADVVVRAEGLRAQLGSLRRARGPARDAALATVSVSLERLLEDLAEGERRLSSRIDRLDIEVADLRMVPFDRAVEGLARLVRDLSVSTGKRAHLEIEGAHVRLDGAVVDGLRDPLRHLVRNSVDHGIETPERRATAGKPLEGRIWIHCRQEGSDAWIEVGDDGGGLDRGAIRSQAEAMGLEAEASTDLLVFAPALSTAREVTDVSGRGMGLDAVRRAIDALHGSIRVQSEPGRSARFSMRLPIDLSTVASLVVREAGVLLAFPAGAIASVVRFDPERVVFVEGRRLYRHGDQLLPTGKLSELLGLPGESPTTTACLVLRAGSQGAVIAAEEVFGLEDLVLRPLGPRLRAAPTISGAALRPDGGLIWVVAADAVLRRLAAGRASSSADDLWVSTPKKQSSILVVDDSVTTRALLRSILENAGYLVTSVADGVHALAALEGGAFDLIVSDVQMPRMDGIALTEKVRGSTHSDLPIVLVTALHAEEDRARGLRAGADAYIVKSTFEQGDLLDVVRRLT